MQPVGQLDQDHARILGDRQQQLAVVLDLPLLASSRSGNLAILVRPSTIARSPSPNSALDVLERDVGVLDDVVQQAAGDGRRIELQVGEDVGHFDRVRDVRLARVTHLSRDAPPPITIGAHEQLVVELIVNGSFGTRPNPGITSCTQCRRHNRPASAKLV